MRYIFPIFQTTAPREMQLKPEEINVQARNSLFWSTIYKVSDAFNGSNNRQPKII